MPALSHAARQLADLAISGFWLFWIAVFLAALCCPANAAPPRVLYIYDGGFETVAVVNGKPENVPFDTVLDFRSGSDPDGPVPPTDPNEPDEPGEPEPDIDKELASKVQAWAEAIDDPIGAQAISWAYTRARGDLDEGKLDPQTVWPQLKKWTHTALDAVEGSKDWQPFADKLNPLLNDRINDLQTVPAVRRMLLTIQYGIDRSADGANAIDLDTLDRITRAIDR